MVIWLCGAGILGSSDHAREQDCLQLFDTPSQGVYVCREHIDLVVALQIAEEMGREECERAFQQERWNCSNFSILKAPNITKMGKTISIDMLSGVMGLLEFWYARVCIVINGPVSDRYTHQLWTRDRCTAGITHHCLHMAYSILAF